jgi:hypothetical protein
MVFLRECLKHEGIVIDYVWDSNIIITSTISGDVTPCSSVDPFQSWKKPITSIFRVEISAARAEKRFTVQYLERWTIRPPLSVNVFVTLATQEDFEYHCKAIFETHCILWSKNNGNWVIAWSLDRYSPGIEHSFWFISACPIYYCFPVQFF